MMTDLELQLRGWRLTTAEIIYHLPDHPALLQSYIWQDLDLTPDFPALKRFLGFWERSLEGRLHSVKVCSGELIKPASLRTVDAMTWLH